MRIKFLSTSLVCITVAFSFPEQLRCLETELWVETVNTKLVNGGGVDPGQPVDPLTRFDKFDPSLVKIDKFPVILTGWTGSARPNLNPVTKMRPEQVKFTSLVNTFRYVMRR